MIMSYCHATLNPFDGKLNVKTKRRKKNALENLSIRYGLVICTPYQLS